jgi:hypothetical protein
VKGHTVWHGQQAKAIECKERHQTLSHDPCGSLNDLCF